MSSGCYYITLNIKRDRSFPVPPIKRPRCSNCYRSRDVGLRMVIANFEILNSVVENRCGPAGEVKRRSRSEEHTSELQSLMRSSYAVFCLKKKKQASKKHTKSDSCTLSRTR